MKIQESNSRKIFNWCNVAFMIVLGIITLYPFLYITFASFSNSNLLMRHEGLLLKPEGFSIEAYKSVFNNPNIWRGYKNTIIILVAGVTVNIVMTALGGYFLSRKNVMFKGIITKFIMFTMFFNGGIIPTYLTIKNLGILNTYWAVILPVAISTYNMIIMRTGFEGVPDSLEEAAKIDGAGHWTILFAIMLPLVKATTAVMVLYYAVSHWNSWFNAMMYLQKARQLQPLQLVLRGILIENELSQISGTDALSDREAAETIKYAVIIVSTLPILAAYPFLQKYFVKGVMVGAVKG